MDSNTVATVASLVNLGVTIFGGFIFMMTIKSRQAVQDVLLQNLSNTVDRLEKTVEALRRGDGWIQSPLNRHVDREY